MSEPRGTIGVWLANTDGRVAHSLNGTVTLTDWFTRCGRLIGTWPVTGRNWTYGATVRWDSLNHDRIRPCRQCFPAPPVAPEGEK